MALEAFTEVLRRRRLLSSQKPHENAEDLGNSDAEGSRREAAGVESPKSVDLRRNIFMSRKPEVMSMSRMVRTYCACG